MEVKETWVLVEGALRERGEEGCDRGASGDVKAGGRERSRRHSYQTCLGMKGRSR